MDDVVSPRRPWDPPWRSRTAHRQLDRDVAALLARAREQRGWSVADAAWRVGITPRMLRYLEAGQRVPSTVVADDLARVYELAGEDTWLLASVALPNVGHASPWRTGEADRQNAI